MIEPFGTEQYLPCGQSELFGTDRRKTIAFENAVVGLRNDTSLLPMAEGFIMSVQGGGVFLVDNNTVELLNRLVQYPTMRELVCLNSSFEHDLERLNYYELLNFGNNSQRKLDFHSVPEKITRLYSKDESGWFSYIPTKIELDLSRLCNFKCVH